MDSESKYYAEFQDRNEDNDSMVISFFAASDYEAFEKAIRLIPADCRLEILYTTEEFLPRQREIRVIYRD